MKKKCTAVIGMVVCFMMMATFTWAIDIPTIPNGTVTDGNLVWLKNANCFGLQTWSQAMSRAATLKSGECGLTDGSKGGDWRLPTRDELLVVKKNKSYFRNVQPYWYWSSSTSADNPIGVWIVLMGPEFDDLVGSRLASAFMLPVRAAK